MRVIAARVHDGWCWATLLATAVVCLGVMSVRPRYWPRTVRSEWLRQCYFTGARAVPFVCMIAVFVGVGMFSTALVWIRMAGQTDILGPFLAMVLVREVGPLMVNLIVLGRSGTAITAEVGTLKATGQVRVLEAQGMDPVVFILLPRVTATALSVVGLYFVFLAVAIASGYTFGRIAGSTTLSFGAVINRLLLSMRPADVLVLAIKTIVPGIFTALICGLHGLSVGSSMTEVPHAVPRAFVHAMLTLFAVCGLVSLLI